MKWGLTWGRAIKFQKDKPRRNHGHLIYIYKSHCFMGCVRKEHKRKTEEALITPMSNSWGSGVPVTPRHFRSCWPSTSIEWQPPRTLHSGWQPHSGNPRTWSKVWAISEVKEHRSPDITPRDLAPLEWHSRRSSLKKFGTGITFLGSIFIKQSEGEKSKTEF